MIYQSDLSYNDFNNHSLELKADLRQLIKAHVVQADCCVSVVFASIKKTNSLLTNEQDVVAVDSRGCTLRIRIYSALHDDAYKNY